MVSGDIYNWCVYIFYRFVYFGPESISQPRATSQTTCDAVTNKSYLDKKEISTSFPIPHVDQPLDLPTVPLSNMRIQPPPFEYNFTSIPDSQDTGNKSPMSSQASADSQCSSGYYSENSSLSNSCSDSFLSSSRTPLYPKGTCKRFKFHEKKYRGNGCREDDRSTTTAALSTVVLKHPNSYCYSASTSSCVQSDKKCFAQSSPLNKSDSPHLPPFHPTKKKIPQNENQDLCKHSFLAPKTAATISGAHRRQHDGFIQSMAFESSSLITEKLNRFVLLTNPIQQYSRFSVIRTSLFPKVFR